MSKPKIIIVDDSPSMRSLAHIVFGQAGFIVFDTDREAEAMRFVIVEKPDVVLLDLSIPEFPIEQFILQAKEARSMYDIPMKLLIYSGRRSRDIRELASHYDVDGYIPKMLGIHQCVDVIVKQLQPQE